MDKFGDIKGLPKRKKMIEKLTNQVDDWDTETLISFAKDTVQEQYDNMQTIDLYHYHYKPEIESNG